MKQKSLNEAVSYVSFEIQSKLSKISNNMQTLAHTLEQKQEHDSLPVGSTSLESSEAIKPEALSSSISGEEIIPYDIRPLTPEVTYPYPLYKSDDYYNKRLAMKPNQVCSTNFRRMANIS